MIAKTPEPPYYAVIFTSHRTSGDNGYAEVAKRLVECATKQTGFLGAESVRDENGVGITVSYWDTLESISRWKEQSEHMLAQKGKEMWYTAFGLRVCKVERNSFM